MDIKDFFKPKSSKRDEHISEHGKDPKTGLTARHLILSDETRVRGGKNSRRRTARVWVPPESS